MSLYIVNNDTVGGPATLLRRSNTTWKKVPRGGVLRIDDTATIFRSREAARQAIERTVAYDEPMRLRTSDPEHEYSIVKLESEVAA